jgi:hypothetical protein
MFSKDTSHHHSYYEPKRSSRVESVIKPGQMWRLPPEVERRGKLHLARYIHCHYNGVVIYAYKSCSSKGATGNSTTALAPVLYKWILVYNCICDEYPNGVRHLFPGYNTANKKRHKA